MDWARAIARNTEALRACVAALFALLGRADDGLALRIAPGLRWAVLRGLRPAESAVRRLIVIAARGLVAPPAVSRLRSGPRGSGTRASGTRRTACPAFALFDPRKRFGRRRRRAPSPGGVPRISVLGHDPTVAAMWAFYAPPPASAPEAEADDGLVNAAPLRRRLLALTAALEDVPGQAMPLACARARREKVPSLRLKSPLRPGLPPGYRARPLREVDHVLVECHGLALYALRLDTS
jgi:hypothetical protein